MNARMQIGLVLLALAGVAGCSVTPMTYEESLQTPFAKRNDIEDWDTAMRYRIGFQYANAARWQAQNPRVIAPADPSMDFQLPFAIFDTVQGNTLSGGLGFLDWFNSGLGESATYSYYYNRTLGFVGHPNTHYYTFDDREGTATAEDVLTAWDEAHALFEALHNADGKCYVMRYREDRQYASTLSKNVPGKYRETAYWCSHPTLPATEYKVFVSAYAHPVNDSRVLASVESQCWVSPPKGELFVDVRDCGMKLANHQFAQIPESRFGWMQLIVTPKADQPEVFEVVSRYRGEEVVLPAAAATEEYKAFLASRPYEVVSDAVTDAALATKNVKMP